ncbi:MAG: hypothetical protein GWP08_18030 [Nitrospiraceae bacterium]|nr:hypothetical protein [Nitrospiraceae bacterium]
MAGQASTIIAEGFLKGVFDVFDAMLSLDFAYDITDVNDVNEEGVRDSLGRFPFVMRAHIESGGAVALLLSVADASAFVSLVSGGGVAAKERLGESDLATLREIADPCLGAGITSLMEQFGRDVEQPQDVSVGVTDTDAEAELTAFLKPPLLGATFTFSAPDMASGGMLLFSAATEALVPSEDAAPVSDSDLAGGAEISEAEMTDILSGFTPAETDLPAGSGAMPPPESTQGNIERVLDIPLMATARLGRVEMPIGDILALGPGSIIDVGHLVDEPVELLVNNKLIARGDVVVVDERFGLRVTEIVSPEERIESLH